MREKLEKKLGLPVFVENDANAAAFSELWYGPVEESNVRTLLFVLVVEGLGTGLIINGELHVGSPLGLGGFGHMSIDPNGELCSCGRRGCWETFASERATVERYHRVTAKQGLPIVGLQELIGLANKGDQMAIESLKITGEYLGEGISNLVHGIYPNGRHRRKYHRCLASARADIRERVHTVYGLAFANYHPPASVQRPAFRCDTDRLTEILPFARTLQPVSAG